MKIMRMPEGQYQETASPFSPQLNSIIPPDVNRLLLMLKAGNLQMILQLTLFTVSN